MVAEGSTKETRAAARFFWAWLILATTTSVAFNVVHAVLTAPAGNVQLAAVGGIVAPVVLLGSTHGVGKLVKARRTGFAYWCAIATTLALAVIAFLLSFDALRHLAMTVLGMAPSRAWLWPVAIDMSIANSTLSLLSLSPPLPQPIARSAAVDVGEVREVAPTGASPSSEATQAVTSTPPANASGDRRPTPPPPPGPPAPAPAALSEPEPAPSERVNRPLAAISASSAAPGDAIDIRDWRSAADELVRDGVTSKDPAIVAAVLAEKAAGTAPSTISRRHNLHHTTVGRILEGHAEREGRVPAAECLTG